MPKSITASASSTTMAKSRRRTRKPSRRPLWPVLRLQLAELGQRPLGDRERGVRRGRAGVDRGVEQHLADLVGGDAVANGAADVQRKLVLGAQRGQQRER